MNLIACRALSARRGTGGGGVGPQGYEASEPLAAALGGFSAVKLEGLSRSVAANGNSDLPFEVGRSCVWPGRLWPMANPFAQFVRSLVALIRSLWCDDFKRLF